MKLFFNFLFLSITYIGISQVEIYNPSVNYLDLSKKGEQKFIEKVEKAVALYDKMEVEKLELSDLSAEEKTFLENFSETEEYWSPVSGGCSWYCGGGPDSVSSTSQLNSQGSSTYKPSNAHDLNYKTAWIEGVQGNGVGEKLIYHFNPGSPRINEINIVNGYVKNANAYKNNSRAKKIKIYYNDSPIAIVNLKDVRGTSTINTPLLGVSPDLKTVEKTEWTLTFEILEYYQGEKYQDLAITEIYFDGIDVHCLSKGTEVLMSDSTTKKIENLKINDVVLAYDEKLKQSIPDTILELASPKHYNLVTIRFKDSTSIICTNDHPLFSINKGWASLSPEKTKFNYKGFSKTNLLKTGDVLKTINGAKVIESITFNKEFVTTYTIVKLKNHQSYFANDIIVGTEELINPVILTNK